MNKAQRKAQWFAQFEAIVTKARPDLSGKIDWNFATHLQNSGLTPAEGAHRFLTSQTANQ